MGKVAVVFGVLLMVLGIGFYIATGGKSITAMIPAFVGAPILICGALALNPTRTKAAMHAAAVFGLLGCLGSFSRLPKLMAAGPADANPVVLGETAAMGVLCLVFVALCVRSFIQARRSRLA